MGYSTQGKYALGTKGKKGVVSPTSVSGKPLRTGARMPQQFDRVFRTDCGAFWVGVSRHGDPVSGHTCLSFHSGYRLEVDRLAVIRSYAGGRDEEQRRLCYDQHHVWRGAVGGPWKRSFEFLILQRSGTNLARPSWRCLGTAWATLRAMVLWQLCPS